MSQRFYTPNEQFADDEGNPYAGGFLYFYVTGSSTPQNTWSDPGLTTPNTNPIVLDSAGRCGSVYLGPNAYKVVLEDIDHNVIWTEDPVQLTSTNNLFIGGTTTGSADAQVLATNNLTPTGFTMTPGYQINAIAGFTNDGPATLNANGQGAFAIEKASTTGPVALTGGELVAGQPFSAVVLDATHFFLLSIPPAVINVVQTPSPSAGTTSGDLKGASTGGATASWTVSEIVMSNELLAAQTAYKGFSLTFNFNGGTVGANGMDTGTMPAGGYVDIYAITKGDGINFGTLGCNHATTIGLPIYEGTNMPAGWVASGLIGTFPVDGGGNFVTFYQQNRSVAIPQTNALTNGAGGLWTGLSLGAIVPPNARSVSGSLFTDTGPGSFGLTVGYIASTADGIGAQWSGHNAGNAGAGGNTTQTYTSFSGLLITGQTMYYGVSPNVGDGLTINISGYTF